jgi:hypothetical protein
LALTVKKRTIFSENINVFIIFQRKSVCNIVSDLYENMISFKDTVIGHIDIYTSAQRWDELWGIVSNGLTLENDTMFTIVWSIH